MRARYEYLLDRIGSIEDRMMRIQSEIDRQGGRTQKMMGMIEAQTSDINELLINFFDVTDGVERLEAMWKPQPEKPPFVPDVTCNAEPGKQ